MKDKIRCVILDCDNQSIECVTKACDNSMFAEIIASFCCPRKFLNESHDISFDLILLELSLPHVNGFQVARAFGHKSFIFITSDETHLKEATQFAPIDLITKPFEKERLHLALEKAFKLLKGAKPSSSCELFNVAESHGQVKIQLDDILFVEADTTERRHKHIILKNGRKYTILYCTFDRLLSSSSKLLQVNKSQLISIDALAEINDDVLTLDIPTENGKLKQATLSRVFKNNLRNRIPTFH